MALDEQVRASGGPQLQLTRQVMDTVGEKVKEMPPRDPRLDHARDAIRERLVGTLGAGSHGDPTRPTSS